MTNISHTCYRAARSLIPSFPHRTSDR